VKSDKWMERILEGKGSLSLASLLRDFVRLSELRKLAKELGKKPKGFRVEKANAKQLSELLSKDLESDRPLLEAVCRLLEEATEARAASSQDPAPVGNSAALEKECKALRVKLETAERAKKTAEQSASKARRSLQQALRSRDQSKKKLTELRASKQALKRQLKAATGRVHDLEKDLSNSSDDDLLREQSELRDRIKDLEAQDGKQRLEIAELLTELRDSEDERGRLLEVLPRGERERLKKKLSADEKEKQELQSSSLMPCFRDEFRKTLDLLDREARRRVHVAIAHAVLYGPGLPGLHMKTLKGQSGLCSLRAGIGMRVYFQRRGEELVFEHVGPREDQDAFLKRRRDGSGG